MLTTVDLIARVKARHGLTSDAALARALEMTERTVARWRSGRNWPDDVTAARLAAIGRALDVSPATAARWQRDDAAPRVAMLAAFWLTRWGRSQLDAHLANEAAQLAALVECLQRDRAADAARFARLIELADFGSANAPAYVSPGSYSRPRAVG